MDCDAVYDGQNLPTLQRRPLLFYLTSWRWREQNSPKQMLIPSRIW